MATETPAESGPSPEIAKLETLTSLDSVQIGSLTTKLTAVLKTAGQASLHTPETKTQEDNYLEQLQSKQKRGLFSKKKDLNAPDRLMTALELIYPKEAADNAYTIIRGAQVQSLGGTLLEGATAQKMHEQILKYPQALAYFDKQQILFGDNASLRLLSKMFKEYKALDEESRNYIFPVQQPGNEPVEISAAPSKERASLRVKGKDFGMFVVQNEAGAACDNRAGYFERPDGSRFFILADGLNESYMGSLAAEELVDIVKYYLFESGDGNSFIRNLKEDPGLYGRLIGERLKKSQERLESRVSNRELLKNKGAASTLMLVAISPTGEANYLNIGDGILMKISNEKFEDLLGAQRDMSYLSSKEGAAGVKNVKSGTINLKPGERLVLGNFGLNGVSPETAHKLQRLATWPKEIDPGEDDITVVAYEQGDLKEPVATITEPKGKVTAVTVEDDTNLNEEVLESLKKDEILSLSRSIIGEIRKAGDRIYKDEKLDQAEEAFLISKVKLKGDLLDMAGHRPINVNDKDKLWLIVNILYPQQVADRLYEIIRTSQLTFLKKNVSPQVDVEGLHARSLSLSGDEFASLNNQQYLFGNHALLKILKREINSLKGKIGNDKAIGGENSGTQGLEDLKGLASKVDLDDL